MVVRSATWKQTEGYTGGAMSLYGCAASPRKGHHKQRRRTGAVPTRIQVSPGRFSSSMAAAQASSALPRDSDHAVQAAAHQQSLRTCSNAPVPDDCTGNAVRALADVQRESGLSSFISRAQQLESKLLRQRTSALARDISRALDDCKYLDSMRKDSSLQQVCAKRDCDRAPTSSDMCCVVNSSVHNSSFWSKGGCTVVQLVQETL